MNPTPTKRRARAMPMTPDAMRLQQALQSSEPLRHLRDVLVDANARFKAIRPALPEALIAHVKPGPADETGWSLFVSNASVGAKLRQLQPRLESLLHAGGWAVCTIRVKVRAG